MITEICSSDSRPLNFERGPYKLENDTILDFYLLDTVTTKGCALTIKLVNLNLMWDFGTSKKLWNPVFILVTNERPLVK